MRRRCWNCGKEVSRNKFGEYLMYCNIECTDAYRVWLDARKGKR